MQVGDNFYSKTTGITYEVVQMDGNEVTIDRLTMSGLQRDLWPSIQAYRLLDDRDWTFLGFHGSNYYHQTFPRGSTPSDPCTCHLLPKTDTDGSAFTGLCKSCEAAATEAGYDRYARGGN